ncbi:hypothetical protein RN001_012863 [Aquatica leii]|uniref:Uncharacterized protein n=1 Tax=Aquatica leii TaxID=1421715 RepID=A0AAN7P809_9COLE|nr:hypothetical protein RN001_012863 [Aquatica leii]
MSFKVFVIAATLAIVNAGYLEPALRYAAPAPAIGYHAAPLVSYTSPAITKTEFIPGSYSSSYRSDVITPRVKYTETPAINFAVHQPAIAVAPVARIAHAAPIVPALPALAPAPLALPHASIARVGYGLTAGHSFAAPLAHGYLGHSNLGAPLLARGYGW